MSVEMKTLTIGTTTYVPVDETARTAAGTVFADGSTLQDKQAQLQPSSYDSPVRTQGSGSEYTATVPGITSLTAGVGFIMIPHTASTNATPTLNVNSLGAKTIKRTTSTISGTLSDGYTTSWLGSGNPVHVIYNGTYWVVQGLAKPNINDLGGLTNGAIPVNKGGTGFTTHADTAYTTARYRASALYDEMELVAPTVNGVINWGYK